MELIPVYAVADPQLYVNGSSCLWKHVHYVHDGFISLRVLKIAIIVVGHKA